MDTYIDLAGSSGIRSYKIGLDYIIVKFKTGSIYLYDYASTGILHVEKMKSLAMNGDGLNKYTFNIKSLVLLRGLILSITYSNK